MGPGRSPTIVVCDRRDRAHDTVEAESGPTATIPFGPEDCQVLRESWRRECPSKHAILKQPDAGFLGIRLRIMAGRRSKSKRAQPVDDGGTVDSVEPIDFVSWALRVIGGLPDITTYRSTTASLPPSWPS
jgi:hypothetical protein